MPFQKGQSGNPKGRPKGVPNKITADLRAAIMQAFANVDGSDYLTAQAETNPQAFLTLLGKLLPTALAGSDGEGPVELVYRWRNESKSTAATNPDKSSGRTMNGHNGSVLGSHTDEPGKQ